MTSILSGIKWMASVRMRTTVALSVLAATLGFYATPTALIAAPPKRAEIARLLEAQNNGEEIVTLLSQMRWQLVEYMEMLEENGQLETEWTKRNSVLRRMRKDFLRCVTDLLRRDFKVLSDPARPARDVVLAMKELIGVENEAARYFYNEAYYFPQKKLSYIGGYMAPYVREAMLEAKGRILIKPISWWSGEGRVKEQKVRAMLVELKMNGFQNEQQQAEFLGNFAKTMASLHWMVGEKYGGEATTVGRLFRRAYDTLIDAARLMDDQTSGREACTTMFQAVTNLRQLLAPVLGRTLRFIAGLARRVPRL